MIHSTKLTRGILIVFEGIDGSGKSTQISMLHALLIEKGLDAVVFREPSQSPWGLKIREKALVENSLTPEEELELFVKDRKANVKENLKPALKEKKIVLLDRYYYSTMAYQGAKGLEVERIRKINEGFVVPPDLVFILDTEADIGLKRIENRKSRDMLFEQSKYLADVREIFRSLRGDNIYHIDGNRSADTISEEIVSIVLKYISGIL